MTARRRRPHVLFYGHYDVQPVDPLALWNSDPFEPTLVPQPDGDMHIVARGASDDKGQLLTFIEACRAWKAATGNLPIRVSMLFEGEEEISSPSLAPFLERTGDELKADVVLVCDTDMWDAETPAVTTMLRGVVKEEIEITCADRDLHSGIYGNAARNALQVMSDVIASLRTPDGGVAVAGFYDGVEELPAAVKTQWQRLPFDEAGFLGDVGLHIPAGEQGRSVLEQVWARPSCEIQRRHRRLHRARVSRPSSRRRPGRNCHSASSQARTRKRSAQRSARMSGRRCPMIAA